MPLLLLIVATGFLVRWPGDPLGRPLLRGENNTARYAVWIKPEPRPERTAPTLLSRLNRPWRSRSNRVPYYRCFIRCVSVLFFILFYTRVVLRVRFFSVFSPHVSRYRCRVVGLCARTYIRTRQAIL